MPRNPGLPGVLVQTLHIVRPPTTIRHSLPENFVVDGIGKILDGGFEQVRGEVMRRRGSKRHDQPENIRKRSTHRMASRIGAVSLAILVAGFLKNL